MINVQDKTLTCRDCGAEFVFTVGEQEFYAQKGFTNEPSRCPACRSARKSQRGESGGFTARREREMFPAVCAQCGKATQVPFQPRSDRPVYCSDCFSAQRLSGGYERNSSGRDRGQNGPRAWDRERTSDRGGRDRWSGRKDRDRDRDRW